MLLPISLFDCINHSFSKTYKTENGKRFPFSHSCAIIFQTSPARRGEGGTAVTEPSRSRAIEFYRFLFSIVVCLFHFRIKGGFSEPTGYFNAGYLGVEFFSIISGCFLMESIRRGRSALEAGGALPDLTCRFAARRFARLYPHYLLTLIAFLSLRVCFLHTLTLKELVRDGFFEWFLLQSFGTSFVVLLFWYVSALFLGSVLLYWLGLAWKDHFPIAMAFAAPVLFSLFAQYCGTLDCTMSPAPAASQGLWRVIAGLALGCVVSCLVRRLRPILQGRFALASTVLEAGLLLVLLLLMYRTYRSPWDFIATALLALLALSVLLGNSLLTRLLDNPVSGFLGKISYGVYLNQCFFLHLYGPVIPVRSYWRSAAAFLLLNILLSVFTLWLSQCLAALMARFLRFLSQSPRQT